jgi:fumarate reductase subunit C
MSQTREQPTRVYHRPRPATWWLAWRHYFLYMMREATAIFIALFALVYLYFIYQLVQGPEAYANVLNLFRSPGMILFHVVALAFAVYHTWTWFSLTPRLQKVRLGGSDAPDAVVFGAMLAAWLLVSAVVAWVLLGG